MSTPYPNLRPDACLPGSEERPPVLIVEDEALIALQLEDILDAAGYPVVGVVADSQGVLRVDATPVVALVDLNLRDGPTGPQIARDLAERHGTAIVFITANPELIGEPPETAVGFIKKPFSPTGVLSAIAYALGEIPDAALLPRDVNPFPRQRA